VPIVGPVGWQWMYRVVPCIEMTARYRAGNMTIREEICKW
jgi:hypothetical protein